MAKRITERCACCGQTIKAARLTNAAEPAKPRYGKAKPGIDYTLNGRIPSMLTKQRFAYDDLVHCECSAEYGLTYQKCRFCDRGWPDLPYLLKYAVRHYVCEDCAEHYANTALPRTQETT